MANRAEPLLDPLIDEAEIAVLGGMLIDSNATDWATKTLESEDFRHPAHRQIYRAIRATRVRGFEPDSTTLAVRDELREMGVLEDCGGDEYLARIIDIVPTSANLPYYARQMIEHRARKTIAASNGILNNLLVHFGRRLEQVSRGAAASVRTLEEVLAAGLPPLPPIVAPRLAWRGRLTLLAAREKSGKSTLAQAAAAAVSCGGRFLDEPSQQGKVLMLCLDEAIEDAAQRLSRFGAQTRNVLMVDRIEGDPATELLRLLTDHQPDLVVIDTLSRFSASVITDPFKSTDWDRLFGQICLAVRDCDAALVLLHHAKKSDGTYRDSTSIGASVDVILEMEEVGEAPTRSIRARGRWPIESFSTRLMGDLEDSDASLRYELDSGNLSLDARVLLFIESNPGCSTRKVREGVTGRTKDINTAVEGLIQRDAVEDRGGTDSGRKLYKRAGGSSEPPWGPLGEEAENRGVPARNHPGTTSGATGGSRPYREEAGNHPGHEEQDNPQEPRLADWI